MLQSVGHLHSRFIDLENVPELLMEETIVLHPRKEVEIGNHKDCED